MRALASLSGVTAAVIGLVGLALALAAAPAGCATPPPYAPGALR
jgi:hypothetical protein